MKYFYPFCQLRPYFCFISLRRAYETSTIFFSFLEYCLVVPTGLTGWQFEGKVTTLLPLHLTITLFAEPYL